MRNELRHGWGGDLRARDRALLERKEAELELREHPLRDLKFGTGEPSQAADDYQFVFISPVEQVE